MIAGKTWRDVRAMALLYLLLLELLLLPAIFLWPTLAKELERGLALEALAFADFMKRWVRDLRSDLGYSAYLSIQQYFKGTNIVGIACAVLIGTGTIAGERETGTLEFLLSRPISRARILWNKAWVLALCVVVPIFLSSLTIPWLTSLLPEGVVKRSPGIPELLLASWHASLFCLLFLFGTLALSAMLKTQVHVAFAIGALVILQVGIYFVQVLRRASLFALSDHDTYMPILAGNQSFERLFWTHFWMLLAIAGLYGLTWWRFRRMDV